MNQKAVLIFIITLIVHSQQASSQKVKIEDIKEQCQNIPLEKRVRLSVSSFTVATPKANGQFGQELAEMLSNALQNVNCFNVLLSSKQLGEIEGENMLNNSGNTQLGQGPQSGQMKSAQVIVTGKITEYSEGKGGLQLPGVSVGANKVHIGFIIQLVNVQTREIIDSKSIDVDGKSSGLTGARIFGRPLVGSFANKAVADASEKGIIQAVEFIASRKDQMPLPEANSGVYTPKKFNASNCLMLKSSKSPKVMVILPEYHITRIIPDPAGETEVIRRFVESGFTVVDAAMYSAIRGTAKFSEAAKDPMKAIAIGKEFGADIVIYGEGFSERSPIQSGTMISCRARLEVRAVKISDASIIAAHGLEAGGIDNSESVAAKTALRNAGALISDYILEQLCGKQINFDQNEKSSVANLIESKIVIKNINYSQLTSISALIEKLEGVSSVNSDNFEKNTATIVVKHKPKLKEIVNKIIEANKQYKLDVESLANETATLLVK